MSQRSIAIGDVHGCSKALAALLDAIDPQPDDQIIPLGDFLDRGDDVAGTIDRLLELQEKCNLYPILGNHEEMLLQLLDGAFWDVGAWLSFGGKETLESYGVTMPKDIPKEHIEFIRNCHQWCESENHLFLHASYLEKKSPDKFPPDILRWESLRDRIPGPHTSGKRAILGHTSQKNGEILDLGYLTCIDTFCYGTGKLTALEIHTGEIWQADKSGRFLTGRKKAEQHRAP
jgi:serine/threonine protein phosphatase 1